MQRAGRRREFIGFVRRFLELPVTGLAAEMTYFALLSVWPLLIALGASLGFLERVIGAGEVRRIELTFIDALDAVFSTEVTEEVIAPLIEGLLRQQRAGFALGGILVALFLASRVFRAAIRALDTAFQAEERRHGAKLWGLGLLFSLGGVITLTAILSLIVVGPLLGGARAIAQWLGLGGAFEIVWNLARWPVVLAIGTAYLAVLYRTGPNTHNRWSHCFLGALVGVLGIVLVAVGFRIYLELVGAPSPVVADADAAVLLGAQVIGAILAALLWLWLTCIALLTGGLVSAEVKHFPRR